MNRSVSYYWYRMGNQRFMKYLVWSVVFTLTISIQSSHVFAQNQCASPQYGYLGKEGIISCNIHPDIDDVSWYNGTDTDDNPFIRINCRHISGPGKKSNEYDILQNGSLLIRNVQCKHNQSYQVRFSYSEFDLRVNFFVIDPTTSNSGSTLPSEVTSIVQSTTVETDNSGSVTTEPQFTTAYTTTTTEPEDCNRDCPHWIWIVAAALGAIVGAIVIAIVAVVGNGVIKKRCSTNQEGNGNDEGDGGKSLMKDTSQHDENAETGL